jgi:hypothetical protein
MAYGFVASLVCAALGARVVYADFREGTLEAGRELAQLKDVLGSTKTVFFNGTAMNVSTAFTDQSTSEVLDRFEAVCEDHPGFVARALADIPKTLEDRVTATIKSPRMRMGIIRNEIPGEGALTCFTDDRFSMLRDFPSRMAAFVKSHDLAEFGRFRYVYVDRTKAGRTHVMTVWTEGSFKLDEMFPANRDAAGFDSPLVPRPPQAKRILSATSAQVPYGLHIYDSAMRREDLRRFYDQEMGARGWTLAAGEERANTVVYMKNSGLMLYLTLVPKDTRTMITAIETARSETAGEATVHVEE